MSAITRVATPGVVIFRIFGTMAFLLLAMLVLLHPDIMASTMHKMTWSGWLNILA